MSQKFAFHFSAHSALTLLQQFYLFRIFFSLSLSFPLLYSFCLILSAANTHSLSPLSLFRCLTFSLSLSLIYFVTLDAFSVSIFSIGHTAHSWTRWDEWQSRANDNGSNNEGNNDDDDDDDYDEDVDATRPERVLTTALCIYYCVIHIYFSF